MTNFSEGFEKARKKERDLVSIPQRLTYWKDNIEILGNKIWAIKLTISFQGTAFLLQVTAYILEIENLENTKNLLCCINREKQWYTFKLFIYFPINKIALTEFFLVGIQSKCGKIRTRTNSVFGHFSRNGFIVVLMGCLK